MSDRAIFYDPTRRRWSWVKRLGTLAGLVGAVAMGIWLVSLFAAPILPGFRGITVPIGRSLRRRIHLPRRQTKMQQFLLDQERKKLLGQIAGARREFLARAAQPPIRTNNIVAAFYAPWEEVGLHSLDANAKYMTHL